MNGRVVIDFSALIFIDYVSLALLLAAFFYFQTKIVLDKTRSRFIKSNLTLVNFTTAVCLIILILQPKFLFGQDSGINIRILTQVQNKTSSTLIDSAGNDKLTFIMQDLLDDFNSKNEPLNKTSFNRFMEKAILSPNQIFIRLSQTLSGKNNTIRSLKIDGDGLTDEQIERLTSSSNYRINKVVYHPTNAIHTGLIDPTWDREINLGELLNLRVTFKTISGLKRSDNLLNEQYKLQFVDPVDQIVSEQPITNGEMVSLSSTPKVPGLHVFKLRVFDQKGKVISTESIPVEVTSNAEAKILIMQSSPSFETKQVQNWAAENGALVVLNSMVSKDINLSRLTNVNTDTNKKKRYKNLKLSAKILGEFDLLLLDPRRYLSFNDKQKETLASSIKNGLGLILLVDNHLIENRPLFSHLIPNALIIKTFNRSTKFLVYLLDDQENMPASDNPLSDIPLSLTANRITMDLSKLGRTELDRTMLNNQTYYDYKNLAENKSGEVLLTSYSLGLGRIAISLIKDTYRWVSNGEKRAHGRYWQNIIQQIARKKDSNISWFPKEHLDNRYKDDLPRINRKAKLCIKFNLNEPANAFATVQSLANIKSKQRVFLNQSSVVKNKLCASYWPTHIGWHQLNLVDTFKEGTSQEKADKIKTLYFYVDESHAWSSDQQDKKIRSTLAYKNRVNHRSKINKQFASPSYQPVNPWILWSLIVFSMSFVWIESKIHQQSRRTSTKERL